MFYTNRSSITKTFHGVTFQPGETKEVFRPINDPEFVYSSKRQEPPKRTRRTRSSSDAQISNVSSSNEIELVDVESEASKVENIKEV